MFSADYTEAVLGIRTVCRLEVSKNWGCFEVRKSLQDLMCSSDYRGSITFTIFTAIRKHSGQPYLPRAMHFGALKVLSITGGWCWVAYLPSCIFFRRRRGVSKFVNCKELHFKLKTNCGSQCGILTDCFGSYCILLVSVNISLISITQIIMNVTQ